MHTAHSPRYLWQHPHWPNFQFDQKTITPALSAARQAQGITLGQAHAIGLDQFTAILDDIWIDEVISTAAIEGEKLNIDVVRSSVCRMLGLSDTGPVSRHIEGLVAVMQDASENFMAPLDADRLCRWQSALFPGGLSGIHRIQTGQFRSFTDPMQIVGGRIGREVVYYQAPPSTEMTCEMALFLDWFNARPAADDGIVRAALAHLWFETIHPFEDGNGRIGRAIIDRALAQDLGASGRLFSISRQLESNRKAYYAALNQAQKGELDVTPWVLWFVQQFGEACERTSAIIDRALEKQRFWARHADMPFNERQRKVLRKLLDLGSAGFVGGLSAEKYGAIAQISKATATRDLTALLNWGVLVSTGQGKSTRYQLARK